jgi:aminopeptidase N
MKIRHLLYFLTILILVFSVQNIQAQPDELHVGCRHTKQKINMAPLTAEEKTILDLSNGRSDTINILNYDITLDVTNFSGTTIKGACEVLFTPKVEEVEEITLDLLQFTIDSIVGSNGNVLDYDYNGFLVTVDLGGMLGTIDTTSVTVFYHGHPTVDPSGFGGFFFEDGIAYNLGIGLGSNPYNYGRGWFPCFDNFVERSTYDLNVITKDSRRAYCIGTFLEEIDMGNNEWMRRYRMSQELPTYLVGVAIGDYAVHHNTHEGVYGSIPVELIGRAVDTISMINSFAQLGNAIDALEYWFGPYQWERVGYVMTTRGAMEHSTSIAFPISSGTSGSNPPQNRLMAHELAHHWWGNITTLSSPSDMWIKEGNAEYGAHLFTEYAFGFEYFKEVVKDNHKTVLQEAHIDDDGYQPLSGIPYEQTYGTHSYQKGASMMHNLRSYLGDSLFSTGMTSILNEYPYSAIDAATFRDHLTLVTGVDMTSYFDDWIYSPGYANYELNYVNVTANGNEYDVDIEVQQKLLAAPHMHTNAPMEITFIDEGWNTHTERFMVSGEYSTAEFTIPFNPVMEVLNDNNLLNLGRTQTRLVIEETGFTNAEYSNFFQFQVNELEDSVMLSVVHHLTGADPSGSPFVDAVSSTHYWTVSGIVDDAFQAKVTLKYQGQSQSSQDYDLLQDTEDDLILLWRPAPDEEWEEYSYYDKLVLGSTTDGNGFIRIEPLMMGEYTYANGDFPIPTNDLKEAFELTVFPNPATKSFYVDGKLPDAKKATIVVYNVEGKALIERTFSGLNQFSEYIELDGIPQGTYLVKLLSETGETLASEKLIVVE